MENRQQQIKKKKEITLLKLKILFNLVFATILIQFTCFWFIGIPNIVAFGNKIVFLFKTEPVIFKYQSFYFLGDFIFSHSILICFVIFMIIQLQKFYKKTYFFCFFLLCAFHLLYFCGITMFSMVHGDIISLRPAHFYGTHFYNLSYLLFTIFCFMKSCALLFHLQMFIYYCCVLSRFYLAKPFAKQFALTHLLLRQGLYFTLTISFIIFIFNIFLRVIIQT